MDGSTVLIAAAGLGGLLFGSGVMGLVLMSTVDDSRKAAGSWRQLADAAGAEAAAWRDRWAKLNEAYESLQDANRTLMRSLAEATKNDQRDPLTGRFVKATAQ